MSPFDGSGRGFKEEVCVCPQAYLGLEGSHKVSALVLGHDMENLTHYPVLVFAVAFILLSAASIAGAWLHRRYPNITDEHKDDLSVILAPTLTLLALYHWF